MNPEDHKQATVNEHVDLLLQYARTPEDVTGILASVYVLAYRRAVADIADSIGAKRLED